MLPILNPSPTSLPIPSIWVIPVHQPQASCILPGLAIRLLYDIIHVLMPFSQIIPRLPLPQSPKDCSIHLCLFWSRIQGCRYHLSKVHIYVLVYCIGVFLSGLLHSVYTISLPGNQCSLDGACGSDPSSRVKQSPASKYLHRF